MKMCSKCSTEKPETQFYASSAAAGGKLLCHNCNCAKGFYGKCPHEVNILILV